MITLIAVTITWFVALAAGLLGLADIQWGSLILVGAGLWVVWWFIKLAVTEGF